MQVDDSMSQSMDDKLCLKGAYGHIMLHILNFSPHKISLEWLKLVA